MAAKPTESADHFQVDNTITTDTARCRARSVCRCARYGRGLGADPVGRRTTAGGLRPHFAAPAEMAIPRRSQFGAGRAVRAGSLSADPRAPPGNGPRQHRPSRHASSLSRPATATRRCGRLAARADRGRGLSIGARGRRLVGLCGFLFRYKELRRGGTVNRVQRPTRPGV